MAQVGPALVFVGFMGAGKSTAVRLAAEAGTEGLDTDELLERELGMSIADFFERHGEDEFRRREEELALRALEEARGGAIALGGGGVLSERVRRALDSHRVVWLDVPAEEAWRRSGNGKRPLARDRATFEELMSSRIHLYEEVADAIVPGNETVLRRAMPALLELRAAPPGRRLLWASSATGDYPVHAGRGLLGSGYWPLGGRRFGVTDTNVARLYAGAVEPVEGIVEVEPGERSKTLDVAERVWRELAAAGMTRDDHLVALGGGVVGDLAGFCAATYQRGVAVVQVPTTLAAQVDSAYGGKTGVDLPEAKNYVGAYHMPAAVLVDPDTLATLPAEELAAGFVEVLKTGLIAGGTLWERVRALKALDPESLEDVVFACARAKVEVVSADERDSGRRQVLNLGHTVGHAIEAATGYDRYRHGEAVGLGLLAALRLSDADDLRAEVREMLAARELPVRLDRAVDVDAVIEAIGRDKKRTAEGVGFVLLERPGEPLVGRRIDPDRVRKTVEELRD